MKRNNPAVFIAALLVLGCATLGARAAMDDAGQTTGQAGMSGQQDPQSVINKWPAETKTAAQALIQEYGQPDTVSSKMLSWNNKGEWQRVAVYRESFKSKVGSKVGLSHANYIENTVAYAVPSNKTSDLKKFDHNLVIDKSKGTLAARGNSERSNILALNLANDIVTGQRDVASAKSFQQKTMSEAMSGKSSPYTDKLMFTPSGSSGGSSGMTPGLPSGSGGNQPSTQPQQGGQQTSPSSGY